MYRGSVTELSESNSEMNIYYSEKLLYDGKKEICCGFHIRLCLTYKLAAFAETLVVEFLFYLFIVLTLGATN